mgnify:CR=1 FL=1
MLTRHYRTLIPLLKIIPLNQQAVCKLLLLLNKNKPLIEVLRGFLEAEEPDRCLCSLGRLLPQSLILGSETQRDVHYYDHLMNFLLVCFTKAIVIETMFSEVWKCINFPPFVNVTGRDKATSPNTAKRERKSL